jgi:hypothetical protein
MDRNPWPTSVFTPEHRARLAEAAGRAHRENNIMLVTDGRIEVDCMAKKERQKEKGLFTIKDSQRPTFRAKGKIKFGRLVKKNKDGTVSVVTGEDIKVEPISELQHGINKFFRHDFELEGRIAHIGPDIESIIDTLNFLETNKIPFLLEAPLKFYLASTPDIYANFTRGDLIHFNGFLKEKGWPLNCLHFCRFPYPKGHDKESINGMSQEIAMGSDYPDALSMISFNNIEGLLRFYDLCKEEYNKN